MGEWPQGKVNGWENGRLTEDPEGARWSLNEGIAVGRAVRGIVNGWLTEAPEGARWSLNECCAAGRAAAEVGARAWPDAPPLRRGYLIAKVGVAPMGIVKLELAIVFDANAMRGAWV